MHINFPKIPLAGTLLVSYAVYTGFVQISIAHSIILLSLAGFAAFDQYIKSHHTPSLEKKMDELRLELNKELQTQKESNEAKLQELKEEQTRQSIARANASSSSSTKKPSVLF